MLRDAVIADPSVIGGTITLDVPASDPFDQLIKGLVDRDAPEDRRRLADHPDRLVRRAEGRRHW